jgi:hypothetical protein
MNMDEDFPPLCLAQSCSPDDNATTRRVRRRLFKASERTTVATARALKTPRTVPSDRVAATPTTIPPEDATTAPPNTHDEAGPSTSQRPWQRAKKAAKTCANQNCTNPTPSAKHKYCVECAEARATPKQPRVCRTPRCTNTCPNNNAHYCTACRGKQRAPHLPTTPLQGPTPNQLRSPGTLPIFMPDSRTATTRQPQAAAVERAPEENGVNLPSEQATAVLLQEGHGVQPARDVYDPMQIQCPPPQTVPFSWEQIGDSFPIRFPGDYVYMYYNIVIQMDRCGMDLPDLV